MLANALPSSRWGAEGFLLNSPSSPDNLGPTDTTKGLANPSKPERSNTRAGSFLAHRAKFPSQTYTISTANE